MAVSGSVDFNLSASEIIVEARRKIGIHDDEEPLENQDLQTGLRTMTMMLKTWQAEGVMCWTMTEGTLTLVQSDYDYVFGAGGTFTTVPLDILDCRITRNSSSIPMMRLSREDYYNLPDRSSEGYPTQFYYDRQRSGGTLYVWPAPDASAGTLNFTYRRLIMDMDASVDNPDVPQEWLDAMVYGLAKRLAENYGLAGTPDYANISAEAGRTYGVVKGLDVGEGMGTIMINPAGAERW
jgi:hypothetical protein